jgi:Tyrosine phosphatase family
MRQTVVHSSRPSPRPVHPAHVSPAPAAHAATRSCSKDRTGILVMLILRVCGATFHAILNEYMMSTETMALWGMHGADMEEGLQTSDVLSVERGYMAEAVEHIKRKYGDVPEYLSSCGVGPEARRAVRGNLLVHPEQPHDNPDSTEAEVDEAVKET